RSRFAMNVIARGDATTTSGTSSIEMWFAARITGPVSGTFSDPDTRRPNHQVKNQPDRVFAGAWNRPRPSGTREPMSALYRDGYNRPFRQGPMRRQPIGHRGTAGGRPPPGARPQRPGRPGDVPLHGHRQAVRRSAVPTQPAGQGPVRRPRVGTRGMSGRLRV